MVSWLDVISQPIICHNFRAMAPDGPVIKIAGVPAFSPKKRDGAFF
jgi:hypothetical protein